MRAPREAQPAGPPARQKRPPVVLAAHADDDKKTTIRAARYRGHHQAVVNAVKPRCRPISSVSRKFCFERLLAEAANRDKRESAAPRRHRQALSLA